MECLSVLSIGDLLSLRQREAFIALGSVERVNGGASHRAAGVGYWHHQAASRTPRNAAARNARTV